MSRIWLQGLVSSAGVGHQAFFEALGVSGR